MAFALRPDAVRALEDARLDAFLARAKAHAAHHFPDVAEDLGDAGLDRMARLAIGRGNLYGLGGERHALRGADDRFSAGHNDHRLLPGPWLN